MTTHESLPPPLLPPQPSFGSLIGTGTALTAGAERSPPEICATSVLPVVPSPPSTPVPSGTVPFAPPATGVRPKDDDEEEGGGEARAVAAPSVSVLIEVQVCAHVRVCRRREAGVGVTVVVVSWQLLVDVEEAEVEEVVELLSVSEEVSSALAAVTVDVVSGEMETVGTMTGVTVVVTVPEHEMVVVVEPDDSVASGTGEKGSGEPLTVKPPSL